MELLGYLDLKKVLVDLNRDRQDIPSCPDRARREGSEGVGMKAESKKGLVRDNLASRYQERRGKSVNAILAIRVCALMREQLQIEWRLSDKRESVATR